MCAPGTINQKSRRAEASLRKRKERIEGGTVCVGGKKALLSHLPPYNIGKARRAQFSSFSIFVVRWRRGWGQGGTVTGAAGGGSPDKIEEEEE